MVIKEFSSLVEAREWEKTAMASSYGQSITEEPAITNRLKKGWYGEAPTIPADLQERNMYQYHDLLARIESEVAHDIEQQIPRGLLPKKKLLFTDRQVGVFSFDAAALGFYQRRQLYSERHKRTVQFEEVHELGNGRYELKADHSEVVLRPETKEDGRPKISTTNKKVFGFFERKRGSKKALDLYITSAVPADWKGNKMAYNGLAAVILAKRASIAGVPVRINLVLGGEGVKTRKDFGVIITVKQYDEALDVNAVSLMCADPAWIRFEGYKLLFKGAYTLVGEQDDVYPMRPQVLRQHFDSLRFRPQSTNKIYLGGAGDKQEVINQVHSVLKGLES